MSQLKILQDTALERIWHLQASSNYTILYLQNGKSLISGYSLKVFENYLAEQAFIRIDRSNLVNTTFINGIFSGEFGQYFQLKNKTEILIPRRRQALLIAKYPNLFSNLKTA